MIDTEWAQRFMDPEDRQKCIDHILQVLKEELERPGSYFEFGQTIPWNLKDERTMGIRATSLRVFTELPVKFKVNQETNETAEGMLADE